MTLNEFLDFNYAHMIVPEGSALIPEYWGFIKSLCRVDYNISYNWAHPTTHGMGRLNGIFMSNNYISFPNTKEYMSHDYEYMFRSGKKQIRDVFERYQTFYKDNINQQYLPYEYITYLTQQPHDMPVLDYLMLPLYRDKVDTWLRIWDDLTQEYKPFSNYFLDEEMVRNEKTGSSHSANETETATENWTTGSAENHENNSSETSDTGSVTQKVMGYNSTAFVDSSQSVPDTTTESSNDTWEESSTTDHGNGTSSGSSDNWRDYEENKSYLLSYTGALDVDFQEWLRKEIDMRRHTLIEDVIYADIDEYFCKGVY